MICSDEHTARMQLNSYAVMLKLSSLCYKRGDPVMGKQWEIQAYEYYSTRMNKDAQQLVEDELFEGLDILE